MNDDHTEITITKARLYALLEATKAVAYSECALDEREGTKREIGMRAELAIRKEIYEYLLGTILNKQENLIDIDLGKEP